jgi:hypothetical protein
MVLTLWPEDLETVEVGLRCASAQNDMKPFARWLAENTPKNSLTIRFAESLQLLLSGQVNLAFQGFDAIAARTPAASYLGAVAAQLDDSPTDAARLIDAYVRARPLDPAGYRLQAEIACGSKLDDCEKSLETTDSQDTNPILIARRIGVSQIDGVSLSRANFEQLARDAESVKATSEADRLSLWVKLRSGGDPLDVLIRSPRSGRPEPSNTSDVAFAAVPMSRLPFRARVEQMIAAGNVEGAAAAYRRMLQMFATEVGTWHFASTNPALRDVAKKVLADLGIGRWKAISASTFVSPAEACELIGGLASSDAGPLSAHLRLLCKFALVSDDSAMIAAIADHNSLVDFEFAIDWLHNEKRAVKLQSLLDTFGKRIAKSSAAINGRFYLGELKKQSSAQLSTLQASSYPPALVHTLLASWVAKREIKAVRVLLPLALAESPEDAYYLGLLGELQMQDGHLEDAMDTLSRSCKSARRRHDDASLTLIVPSLEHALERYPGKNATLVETAKKCVLGT